uniref:Uncharacterized protein n=1 Tax=Rhizophora mucronata TaxID=61149 RepID=A0A2P2NRZ0_RHIMU
MLKLLHLRWYVFALSYASDSHLNFLLKKNLLFCFSSTLKPPFKAWVF